MTTTLEMLQRLDANWLRIYWHDYTMSAKCRLVPMDLVLEKLQNKQPVAISITKACLGLLPIDVVIPGVGSVGRYSLQPDWSSLRRGPVPNQVSCHGAFFDQDGCPVVLCPRGTLRRVLESTAAEQGLSFIVGFEIEFIVMRRNLDETSSEQYLPLRTDGHAWSMARVLADWGRDGSFNSVLDELARDLRSAGISIEQLHAEGATGQYELVLKALPALEACDSYLFARQIIESTAARHGFRVTLHPKPFSQAVGNATHAHMSISSPGGNDAAVYESFYAGILEHMRAISAFAYSSPVSYDRLVDGYWAGGRWVTWGSENKEAPLRKCDEGHWEFKALDGMANPYLAMAAILGAGAQGVLRRTPLVWKDCQSDPASLTEAERSQLGITSMLPKSLGEAIEALESDEQLGQIMHPAVVERHIAVKRAEIDMLQSMSTEERRQWLIARY